MTNERESRFPVVIIGGGPAGISAAMGFIEARVRVLLIDAAPHLGGQLELIPSPIVNVAPGLFDDGRTLSRAMQTALEKAQSRAQTEGETGNYLQIRHGCRVLRLKPVTGPSDSYVDVITENETLRASYAIVATGYRNKILPAPTAGFENDWLHDAKALPDALGEMTIAVVGGGDSALLKALDLTAKARGVYVIHRGKKFKARPDVLRALKEKSNCQIFDGVKITSLQGEGGALAAITLSDSRVLIVQKVLVKVGYEPNTEFLAGTIALDEFKHVIVDRRRQSVNPLIFAAGDIINAEHARIATATGDGMKAAGQIIARLAESDS